MRYQPEIHPVTAAETAAVRSLYRKVYREIFHEEPPDFDRAVREEEIHVACCGRAGRSKVSGVCEAGTGEETSEKTGKEIGGTEIAGFLSVWKPGRFIHFLFVAKEYRGQGIGSQFTAYAAKKYGYPLSLRCRETNVPALQFYRADGWQVQLHGHSVSGGWYLLRKGQDKNR